MLQALKRIMDQNGIWRKKPFVPQNSNELAIFHSPN